MYEKKPIVSFKSPDLTKLQEVVIDYKTKIYIALGADPAEAKSAYFSRLEAKNKLFIGTRKAVAQV